jgi:exopolysaccharide biosynthesis protein
LGERLLKPRPPRRFTHHLGDGLSTTVYVATYPRRSTRVRVAALEPAQPLRTWARNARVVDAIAGGFHVAPGTAPLGELWVGGDAHMYVPFDAPWDACRSCVVVSGGEVEIAPRGAVSSRPRDGLLQAGPLLVAGGRSLIVNGRDPEGFGAGSHQFDADITRGRHARAALGLSRERLFTVVCDGNSLRDAGMTLAELAGLMAELGAETAINLGGGGSASLVCAGKLQNRPRDGHGVALLGGRPVASALVLGR